MSDVRQLPLFSDQPSSEEDLNPRSRLRDTLALFQQRLTREGKSEHTINAFTSDMHLLMEYHGDKMAVGEITTERLNKYLMWMENGRGVPCSRKTYARRVTTLKVYFKWLYDVGAIPHDPAGAVLQRSGPAPLATILTPAEIDAALGVTFKMRRGEKPDARPDLVFRLILDTGIKKAEAMRLTQSDILRNPPTVIVQSKNAKDVYKERHIALDAAMFPTYDEYMGQYTPRETIFTCTARNLEYILEHIGNQAGIPKKISFEMLRWTCGVRDYHNGVDPEAIREKLGLSKITWVETFGKIRQLAGESTETKRS